MDWICKKKLIDPEDGDILKLDLDEEINSKMSTLCLIGKVLTNMTFNVFGLLETMTRAMNSPKGFTACELGKNLLSFQFRSSTNMKTVLDREPWHLKKSSNAKRT